jgi:hypothetical protein
MVLPNNIPFDSRYRNSPPLVGMHRRSIRPKAAGFFQQIRSLFMKNAVLDIASVAAVLASFLFIAFWKHQKQRRKLIEGTGITFWRNVLEFRLPGTQEI